MSEKLLHHHRPEAAKKQPEVSPGKQEHGPEIDHKAVEKNQAARVEAAQQRIEQLALSSQETSLETEQQPETVTITGELRQKALEKTLHRIQRHLSKPERRFSRFIHKPAIDKLSEAGSKTVARPSGLLGGGLTAFAGSLALLVFVKRYGYEYNPTTFLLFLIGGFFLGLLIELFIRSLWRRKF